MDTTSPLSLRNLWHVLTLRWRLVMSVALVLFAGLAAYVLSLKTAYTAEAVVLLAPAAEELGNQNTERAPAMTDPFFIRSETAIIGSEELSRAVIEKLKLVAIPEFQSRPGLREQLGLAGKAVTHSFLSPSEMLLDQVLRRYDDQLSVFNDGRSKTVQIGFTAADPRLAASIANAHAQAYLDAQSTRRTGAQQKAIEWLAREVDARATEVRDADARVQQYRLQHGMVGTRDATMVEQRLSQLSTQLGEARRQLSMQTALLTEIRNVRAGADPSNAATLLTYEPLTDLLRNRVQAEAAVAALQNRLVANHPTLVKRRQELASINEVLNSQLRHVESEASSAVSSWQRQVRDLDSSLHQEIANKTKQDRDAAGVPALTAQAQVKRTVFETVLNRYQTLLAERAFLAPTAAIVSHAIPPARPSFPRTALFLLIAAMAAATGGIAAALIVQLFRPTSMSLNAVADALGIQPLAAIPRFRNVSRTNGVIQIEDPRLFIESIRSVRNAVLDRQPARQSTICLLTSVLPRQGKSLVAMSLARAIARGGARTLFLELDLRQPTGSLLARLAPPVKGVASVLERRATVADAVIRDASTGLDMLLAEKNARGSLERLTSAGLADLLTKLRTRYSAIIIDSPPIGLVADALTLASLVDQTILIAKNGGTSVAELARGTRLLNERGATLAGLVLTGVDPDHMSSVDKATLNRYVVGVPIRAVGGAG